MIEARFQRNPLCVTPRPMSAPRPSALHRALLWRTGGQAAAQLLLWSATFVVLRLLDPADYGLVAMAGVVTGFLALLSGQGFAAALIQTPALTHPDTARFLGLLLLINGGLASAQFGLAPSAAAYFDAPRVADLLRVQALAYLAIPFIAIPQALAQRALDFRTPALVDLAANTIGALTTVTLAWRGNGVWALVAGQMVPFGIRAIGLAVACGLPPLPRFDLTRIGALARFGGAVTLNGVVWFLYAQADIVIAGRLLTPHEVGLYSTAFFLAALPVAKLMPILTEVGFSAYARIASNPGAVAAGFAKAARLVSLIAFPMFAGLAAAAPVAIPVVLGPQWADAVPIVRLLALAMPLYAIANLFGPAVNALGRPRIQLGNALAGLAVMPVAFWVGATQADAVGIAAAWALAYPLLFLFSAARSLGVIGIAPVALARAIAPAAIAALVMAGVVMAATAMAPPSAAFLALIIVAGGITYGVTLRLAFPGRLHELVALARQLTM